VDKLCARCKRPFVSWQKPNTHSPTATWRGECCPDCAPEKTVATLDCCDYMQARRLTARLRDGYHILLGRA
jgi:hypothetical protein